jgi:hypothetical protein
MRKRRSSFVDIAVSLLNVMAVAVAGTAVKAPEIRKVRDRVATAADVPVDSSAGAVGEAWASPWSRCR